MHDVRKKIVTDEAMRPVAVQIDYEDWIGIARALGLESANPPITDLSAHSGRLDWPVDGLEYQHSVRSEWR